MPIINYKKEIKESFEELENRLSKLKSQKLRDRCEILLWLKSGKVRSMRQAIILKGMNKSQGTNWWKQYQKEGIDGFLKLNYKGQSSPLNEKKEFVKYLQTTGFNTINEARIWVLKTYDIKYTENGMGNYFRRHKIKLKTGRPHHPKNDEEKRAVYKKNMSKN